MGCVGLVSLCANGGQSEGREREHCTAATRRVDIFTLLCHWECFLTPLPGAVHPDRLGRYSAAVLGDPGGAGEVRLGEREDTGLVQHMQLPRLLGTFKASLQLPPQTGWDPAPLSELQMALRFPARG